MEHSAFLDHLMSSVRLCVPDRSDARLMIQWLNNPEVRQFLMRFGPMMREGEEKYLTERAMQSVKMGAFDSALLLMVEKSTNKRIGTMGLHNIDWKNRNATTGTLIGNKQNRGRGLATDAKMLLLDWAFNELGLNKVESRVIAFNNASLAYANRCGYQRVGLLKRHVYRFGEWHDEVILEVHADEWRPLWKKFIEGKFKKK